MKLCGKKNGNDYEQLSLFNPSHNPPLREAIDFYKHKHGWSNRLIAGDSLLVMNSLLEKEGMAGQVQMIYFDPPYGIKYGSNFQPFVNKRDVKDGKDEDLTAEPEMIKAFRDTWELDIHSYLSYLRNRLLLTHELLHESGSVFVQISDENLHHVRELMDEIFGSDNFCAVIPFATSTGLGSTLLKSVGDFILWYGKQREQVKYRQLYRQRFDFVGYTHVELPDGNRRSLTYEEAIRPALLPKGSRVFRTDNLSSSGATPSCIFDYTFQGKRYSPAANRSWKTNPKGMEALARSGRLVAFGDTLRYIKFNDDLSVIELDNFWTDTGGEPDKVYVVQTSRRIVERCLLMATDPGDLVLDITCGSGTTAVVAEQWGRRWITCDTSRVALTLAKQRLMTSVFDYFQLAHEQEGVGSGFCYKTVPHVTLKSIANSEPPGQETLYDQPLLDNSKTRVSGPFTVEAVPAPMVKSPGELSGEEATPIQADGSASRSGETVRQADWRNELLRCGIRGKGGQKVEFSRVEPLSGTRWLHADAETKLSDKSTLAPDPMFDPKRVVISFGPEHAPLEQRQVEAALEEARTLIPRPKIVVFAAFQFDPEASKDIDELNWPGMAVLKAQMNADLLTEDLKKQRTSNESFWLVGQPDVSLRKAKIKAKDAKGEYWEVEVKGFDYYNTKTGGIESGNSEHIALWMLDTDYDGRSLFPRQVFFPIAGDKEGWSKLAKNLKAEIDDELIEQYRGTISLPFVAGANRRAAVKIVDNRGIESLKIIDLK